jgi:sodium/potassium-transporting ATPase subunit alpha
VKNAEAESGRPLMGDPMELALLEMARGALSNLGSHARLDEISFDTDRMRQSVVYAMPQGAMLYCKGAPESVLALCSAVAVAGGIGLIDHTARERIIRAQEAMAELGLRVLAFASRKIPAGCERGKLERDLIFQGRRA